MWKVGQRAPFWNLNFKWRKIRRKLSNLHKTVIVQKCDSYIFPKKGETRTSNGVPNG